MAVTVETPPSSTLSEDLWSVIVWFANLFIPTLKGTHACKPTMPGVSEGAASNLSLLLTMRLTQLCLVT